MVSRNLPLSRNTSDSNFASTGNGLKKLNVNLGKDNKSYQNELHNQLSNFVCRSHKSLEELQLSYYYNRDNLFLSLMENLKVIYFYRVSITNGGFEYLSENCPNITSLTLIRCQGFNKEGLRHVSKCSHLKCFTMRYKKKDTHFVDALVSILTHTQLEELEKVNESGANDADEFWRKELDWISVDSKHLNCLVFLKPGHLISVAMGKIDGIINLIERCKNVRKLYLCKCAFDYIDRLKERLKNRRPYLVITAEYACHYLDSSQGHPTSADEITDDSNHDRARMISWMTT